MKSFWIFCAAASLLLAPSPTVGSQHELPRSRDQLLNVFLSPAYAQWLVGAIAFMATSEETDSYLALTDDAEAVRFIDEFWSRRPGGTDIPGLSRRDLFERRATEADKKFTESAFPGRRTDRGAIYILYGSPAEVKYEPARRNGEALLEIWAYKPAEVRGLDDSRPDRHYIFQKQGDLTAFAPPSAIRRRRF